MPGASSRAAQAKDPMARIVRCENCQEPATVSVRVSGVSFCIACYEQLRSRAPDRSRETPAPLRHDVPFRYVAIEGLPGAGKTTQRWLLAGRLARARWPIAFIEEEANEDDEAPLLRLLAADKVVLQEGSLFAAIAVECGLSGAAPGRLLRRYERPAPELVILLDLPIEEARDRLVERDGDEADRPPREGLISLRHELRQLALRHRRIRRNFVVIDGSRSAREVHEELYERLLSRFPKLARA